MALKTVRVGGYAPQASVHSRALDRFAEVVTARSNGEVSVEILYNVMDEGRPATHLFDLVNSGELTWCYYSTSYLGNTVPMLESLEVPFLFSTLADAHNALDGELGATLAEAVRADAGYEVLGFWDNGMRHLTNSVRPLRSPEDCAGLRIRLQPNRIHEALARSWGMEPVAAELSEGIAMIKRGDVEAQENPLANTVAYGVEHRHITMTAHLYGARGLFANPAALRELGQAAALVREAATAAIQFQRQAAAEYEKKLQKTLTDEGRLIVELTGQERAAFVAAAATTVSEALESLHPKLIPLLPAQTGQRGTTDE